MSDNFSEERLILDKATRKNEIPAPWQGITVTFKDSIERYSYREQYNKTAYTLCRLFQIGTTIYQIYPEFTESGRIHYHGIYKPETKYKALKMYEKLRKTGFIKIERTISPSWHDYIKKEQRETSKLIGLKDVIINKDMYERILAVESSKRKTIEQFVVSTENDLL